MHFTTLLLLVDVSGTAKQEWLLVAAIGILTTILSFIIRIVTAQVIKKLDDIVFELKQLAQISAIQHEQIKMLQQQDAYLQQQLALHDARIRQLEAAPNQ